MQQRLTLVTISYSIDESLLRTVDSVLAQTCEPHEWVLIISKANNEEILNLEFDNNIRWVLNSDKSIYDALNIGLTLVDDSHVLFLNGGDTFHSKYSVEETLIDIEKHPTSCIQYNCLNHYEGMSFVRPGRFRGIKVRKAHVIPSFVAPCFKKDLLLFDDSKTIDADIQWVEAKKKKYGVLDSEYILSNFYLDGLSSVPRLKTILIRAREISYFNAIKECLKFILIRLLPRKLYISILHFVKGFDRYE